jgi:hypothetical protein
MRLREERNIMERASTGREMIKRMNGITLTKDAIVVKTRIIKKSQ